MAGKPCLVCSKVVDWELVREVFAHILNRVDVYGEASLTEQEQVVYHGQVCSEDCYENLS